ncbi:hypothetical protein Cgig2_009392 [Carnegiea gigantea]|uniref:Uncharacterized protein n=1 Tax=Carnegiea gigantea TaxID=171969 RepID=A0A9Q1K1V7_9CARY|nr:hypothetical protein Cgig2_009392 [Carnegiea gigantea]
MRGLLKLVVQKGHISEVEISNSLDVEENDLTFEGTKPSLKYDGNQGIKQKHAEPNATATLAVAKTTSSAQDLQVVQQERPLKFKEEGGNEKRMYQKVLITRMTTCSFSSLIVQLNKAQTEVVTLIRFSSFLKVNLKQIPGKFSKWLGESFNPYTVCFRVPNGQKFPVIAFDMNVTLDVPFGEGKSSKSPSLPWMKNMMKAGTESAGQSKSSSSDHRKTDDDNEDDDDGALLRFPLRNTSQVNHDLSIKKSIENKSKARD